jgi:hypothetical protein
MTQSLWDQTQDLEAPLRRDVKLAELPRGGGPQAGTGRIRPGGFAGDVARLRSVRCRCLKRGIGCQAERHPIGTSP